MSSAVSPRVQALAQTRALKKFCEVLERYLETGDGEDELPRQAAALAAEAQQLELPPEHILYAMRVTRCRGNNERAFRAEVAVREVRDPASGELWTVHVVHEGYSWDPEIEMHRRDWLSCTTSSERRFISPAPQDWLEWDDSTLLSAMRAAPIDQRQR
jgi:hypothetical protein